MKPEHLTFLKDTSLQYFLKYVQIDSTSDPESDTYPSSTNQLLFGKVLLDDLITIGIYDSEQDEFGYIYARIPANNAPVTEPISFLAHIDTSPSESGKNIKPRIIKNYQGEDVYFPDDSGLILTIKESPELMKYIGEDIITASGTTLLGADDKAGVAAIMAALALFQKDKTLPHPEIKICFTPDEEIGRGVDKISLDKLGNIAFTIDGGEMGELEDECFDAWSANITFHGLNVHPGSAKNVMINAAAIAARFYAQIPEWQTPEHTEKREGFYHLTEIYGNESKAEIKLILRDFILENNQNKISYLEQLKRAFEIKYSGLKMDIEYKHSYQNMVQIISQYPHIINKAEKAITDSGIPLIKRAIRGGTDGARLCYMGIPTPNIFCGGLQYHSRREWIPVLALQKSAEVIVRLSALFCNN